MIGGDGTDRVLFLGGDTDRRGFDVPDFASMRYNTGLQRYEFTSLVWDIGTQQYVTTTDAAGRTVYEQQYMLFQTRNIEEMQFDLGDGDDVLHLDSGFRFVPLDGIFDASLYEEWGIDRGDAEQGAFESITINGGDGDNFLFGSPKADVITAGSGNDYIVGGLGSDEIDGNGGSDTIFGNQPQSGALTGYPSYPVTAAGLATFGTELFEYEPATPFFVNGNTELGFENSDGGERLTDIRPIGDFNGDQHNDFIVAGDNVSYLVFGPIALDRIDDIGDSANIIIDHAALGIPGTGVGDVNGDGFADLAFERRDGDDQLVTIVFGGTVARKQGTAVVQWPRNWNQNFVDQVLVSSGVESNARVIRLKNAPLSDVRGLSLQMLEVDGDESTDLAVLARSTTGAQEFPQLDGSIVYSVGYIFAGSALSSPGLTQAEFSIADAHTTLRTAGANSQMPIFQAIDAGDVDGDGFDDLLIGSEDVQFVVENNATPASVTFSEPTASFPLNISTGGETSVLNYKKQKTLSDSVAHLNTLIEDAGLPLLAEASGSTDIQLRTLEVGDESEFTFACTVVSCPVELHTGPEAKVDAFNATDVAISDNSTVSSTIGVNAPANHQVSAITVSLRIEHTWVSDLSATLIAPDGTRVELFSNVGEDGDDFENTFFNDFGQTAIEDGVAPFNSNINLVSTWYRPKDSFEGIYGVFLNGTWTLEITDSATNDTGFLDFWSFAILPVASGQKTGTDATGSMVTSPVVAGLGGVGPNVVRIEPGLRESTATPIAFGDVNRDGFDDYGLGFENRADLYYGDSQNQPTLAASWVGGDIELTAGDFVADGRTDILAVGGPISSIPLSNLFDDAKNVPLAEAVRTDTFKAIPETTDLGIQRVYYGTAGGGTLHHVNPNVQFELANLGWTEDHFDFIANDAVSTQLGGIRTQGSPIADNEPQTESGIGFHANAFVTFDVDELRAAGGISSAADLRVLVDRAGVNDAKYDEPAGRAPSIHTVVIVSDDSGVISGFVNGVSVPLINNTGNWSFDGTKIPAFLTNDGLYASFDVPVPANAKYVTFLATGAGVAPPDFPTNTIAFDHAVFSGARLEISDPSSLQDARIFEAVADQPLGTVYDVRTSPVTVPVGGLSREVTGFLTFDGDDDLAVLPNTALDGLDDVTATFRLNYDEEVVSPERRFLAILSSANASHNNAYTFGLTNSATQFFLDNTDSSASHELLWNMPSWVKPNQWHDYAVARNTTTNKVEVWIDGVSLGTNSFATGTLEVDLHGITLGQEQDSVGGSFDPTQTYAGQIDELAIWKRTLTATEVQAISAGAIDSTDPDLHAWFRFDEQYGDTLLDSTGNHGAGYLAGGSSRPTRSDDSIDVLPRVPRFDIDGDGLHDTSISLPEFGTAASTFSELNSTVVLIGPDPSTAISEIVVGRSGLQANPIANVSVTLNILHGWNQDLDVTLIAPDGTRVELFTDVGGSDDNFLNTVLDDAAETSIASGLAPFTGTFRPEGNLSDLIGKSPNGTWTLEVVDDDASIGGTLNNWQLTITTEAPQFPLGENGSNGGVFVFYGDRARQAIPAQFQTLENHSVAGSGSFVVDRGTGRTEIFDNGGASYILGAGANQEQWFQFTTLGDGKAGNNVRLQGPVVGDLLDGQGGVIASGQSAFDLRALEAGAYYLRVFDASELGGTFTIEMDAPIRGQDHETSTAPDRDVIRGGEGPDTIDGNGDLDRISGGSGLDTIIGEPTELRDATIADNVTLPMASQLVSQTFAPPLDPVVSIQDAGLNSALQNTLAPREYALQFDGVDDAAQVVVDTVANPNAIIDLNTPSFTVSLWTRFDSPANAKIPLSTYNNDGLGREGYFIYGNDGNSGIWEFKAATASNTTNSISGPAIEYGEWTHLTGSFDATAGTMKFYVNGVFQGEVLNTTYKPNLDPAQLFTLGNSSFTGSTYGFPGEIKDVRLWNSALSDAEVADQVTSTVIANPASLVLHYPVSPGTGDVIRDQSGNGYDASLGKHVGAAPTTSRKPTWTPSSSREDLRATQIGSLRKLDASKLAITGLSGLEYGVNLDQLDLSDNQLDDSQLVSIANLRRLQTLDLSDNASLSDISALSVLANLTRLNLEGTSVLPNSESTLATLAKLPNLTELFLPLGSIAAGQNLVFNEGDTVTISGTSISFVAQDEGITLHTASGVTFPIIVRNVAPTIATLPDLNGQSLLEGQTITVQPSSTTPGHFDVSIDGATAFDQIEVSDVGPVDQDNLVAQISVTDPTGRTTDLTHAAATFNNNLLLLPADVLNDRTNLTVSFWLKTTEKGTQRIVDASGEGTSEEFVIELFDDTTLRLVTQGEVVDWTIPSMADGDYRFFAITRDLANGKARLRIVDEAQTEVVNLETTIPELNLPAGQSGLKTGVSQIAIGQGLIGTLDELTIWNRSLANTDSKSTDIGDLSKGTFQRNDLDLAGYWPLNEGAGTFAADVTRFGRDGRFEQLKESFAYYRFDETSKSTLLHDSSGNANNGTISGGATLGVSVINPRLGPGSQTAGVFDGDDDRIDIPYTSDLAGSSFTVEGWYKAEGSGSRAAVSNYSNGGGGETTGFIVYAEGSNWAFWLGGGSTFNRIGNSADLPVVNGEWIHLVGNYEAVTGPDSNGVYTGTASFYANGALVETKVNVPYKPSGPSYPVSIGELPAAAPGTFFFKGAIDEVRFYDEALTPDQVAGRFEQNARLVAYLPLDETSATTVADDTTNGHTGTISGGVALGQPSLAASLGTAAAFDGVNDKVDVANSDGLFAKSFSVEAWLRDDGSVDSSNRIALGTYDNSTVTGFSFHIQTSDSKWRFYVGDDTDAVNTGESPVVTGQWVHLVGSYEIVSGPDASGIYTGTMSFYVDGVLNETKPNVKYKPSGEHLALGSAPSGSFDFKGGIDEVRVYESVLTADQVTARYQLSQPELLAYLPLNETSGLTVSDATGNGHDGTISGGVTLGGVANNAVNGTSFKFDGVNDQVSLPYSADLAASSFSMSGWFRAGAANTRVAIGTYGNGPNTGFMLDANGNKWRFYVGDGGTGASFAGGVSNSVVVGQWIHLVGTFESQTISGGLHTGTLRLYANGSLVNQVLNAKYKPSGSNRPITLGNAPSNAVFFNGDIDEVRIFGEALTAGQVFQQFNNPPPNIALPKQKTSPLIHLPLNEASGLVATDATGNGHDGILSGGVALAQPTHSSSLGTAAEFDGVNDKITVKYAAEQSSASFTVASWVRPDFDSISVVPLGTYSSTLNQNGYMFQASSGSKWRLYVGGGGTDGSEFDSIDAGQRATGSWTHLAATFQAISGPDTDGVFTGTLSAYSNGELVESKENVLYKPSDSTRPLTVGNLPTGGSSNAFDGAIDEVLFYDRALNSSEVASRYALHADRNPLWTTDVPSALPSGLTLTDNLGGGDFILTVTASDGDGGFTSAQTEFTVANVKPVINDLNVKETGPYVIDVPINFDARDITDPGVDDTFTYLWEVTSDNGQEILSSSNIEFSFTPKYAGNYKVTLTVIDSDGGSDSFSQVFNVNPIAVATVPTTNPVAGSIVKLTSEQSSGLAPTGLLRGTNQSVQRETSWDVQFGGSTVATGTASEIEFVPINVGVYTATLAIDEVFYTDGVEVVASRRTHSDSKTFTVDAAGVISIVGPTATALEGDVLTFSIKDLPAFGDLDGREVKWSVSPSTVVIVPTEDQTTYRFQVTANDNYTVSLSVIDSFAVDLMDDPIARYTFDDASASDSSGNEYDGITNNGVDFVSDPHRAGTTALFDGIDDYIEIARPIADDFTISLWVNSTQASTGSTFWWTGYGLVDGELAGGTGDFGATVVDGRFAFGVGSPDTSAISTTAINDGEWHHVVATRDATSGEIKVYVDSIEENAVIGLSGSLNMSPRLTIGQIQTNVNRFAGKLDDIAIYDKKLSAAEIGHLYSSFTRTAANFGVEVENAKPTIVADNVEGSESSPITLTAEVFDAGLNDTHTYTINWGDGSSVDAGSVSAGSVSQSHTYTKSGTYTATITVTDSDGGVREKPVEIVIGNVAPTAVNDNLTTDEDTVLTIVNANLVANDTDPGSDTLAVESFDARSSAGATLKLESDGSISYDPTVSSTLSQLKQGETYEDTFSYVVSDGQGGQATAVVTVTVTGVNDAPNAIRDLAFMREDAASVSLPNLLGNDSDIDNEEALHIAQVGGSSNPLVGSVGTYGTLNWNTDGSFTYEPNVPKFSPLIHLPLDENAGSIVKDESGNEHDGSVSGVTLGQPARAGALGFAAEFDGVNDSITIPFTVDQTTPSFTIAGWFRADDTDVAVPFGTLDDSPRNGFRLQSGPTWRFIVGSGSNTSASVGTTPVVVGQWVYLVGSFNSVSETSPGSGDYQGTMTLYVNGAFAEQVENVVYSSASDPLTLGRRPGGSFPFHGAMDDIRLYDRALTPSEIVATTSIGPGLQAGETVTDTFNYTVSDGIATDNSVLTITVTGINDPPVSVADTGSVNAHEMLVVPAATGVTSNDTDADDEFAVAAVNGSADNVGVRFTLPSGATLRVKADGEYEYDPNGAFDALALGSTTTDSFTYTITDEFGESSTATVNLTITGTNNSPDAVVASSSSFVETVAANSTVATLSTVDVDAGDTHSYTIVENPGSRFAINNNELQISNITGLTPGEVFYVQVKTIDAQGRELLQVIPVTVLAEPINEDILVNMAQVSSSDLLVRLNGANVEIIDRTNGNAVIRSQPIASTDSITINGADTVDDTVEIDFAVGGFFDLGGNLVFNGGTGSDTLKIVGNRVSTDGVWSATGVVGTGTLVATEGSQSTTIQFTSVEPFELVDLQTLQLSGNVALGANTITLDVASSINLGTTTTLAGGTIHSTSAISVGGDETLSGFGLVNARVSGLAGSTITATGNLSLGDASSPAGFVSEGTLNVGAHTVSLLDSNQIQLGVLTTLAGGDLVAAKGLLTDAGDNISGFGTIDSPDDLFQPVRHNGAAVGNSFFEEIEMTGYVKGIGSLDFVYVSGTYAPGLSPSIATVGNVRLDDVEIEIGGTSPGFDSDNHDQILSSGGVRLQGELIVIPFNSFEATVGDQFLIIQTQDGVIGEFTNASDGTLLPFGAVNLRVDYTATAVTLTAIASSSVPGPTIVDVKIGSSDWVSYVTSHIDAAELLGYDIPWNANQTQPLTWETLDRIYVKFSEDIGTSLDAGKVKLEGVNTLDYASQISSVTYDSNTLTATISLSSPVDVDRLKLTILDTVTSATSSEMLDGEWTTGRDTATSGNGSAGGDFEFLFNILPGDFDGNGLVSEGDLDDYDAAYFTEPGQTAYNARVDGDGDGLISIGDLQAFSDNYTDSLPAGDPGVGSSSSSSSSFQAFTSESSQVVVVDGVEASRTPIGQTASLIGSDQDDTFEVGSSASLSLALDGGQGVDRLIPLSDNESIDLTAAMTAGDLRGVEIVDLTGRGSNELTLTSADIGRMESISNTLVVMADPGDEITTTDDFRITGTRVGNGELYVIAESEGKLLQIGGMGWTNPIDRFDVDGSGQVSALDALKIINALNRDSYASSEPTRMLVDPASLEHFPMEFYDTSSDGGLTALDALRVINELVRLDLSSEPASEPTGEPVSSLSGEPVIVSAVAHLSPDSPVISPDFKPDEASAFENDDWLAEPEELDGGLNDLAVAVSANVNSELAAKIGSDSGSSSKQSTENAFDAAIDDLFLETLADESVVKESRS